jgi:hypothetical protein
MIELCSIIDEFRISLMKIGMEATKRALKKWGRSGRPDPLKRALL